MLSKLIINLVMPLILSVFMTGIVSFVSYLKMIHIQDFSAEVWIGSWLLSWLIAFPALLILLPFVKKLSNLIISKLT